MTKWELWWIPENGNTVYPSRLVIISVPSHSPPSQSATPIGRVALWGSALGIQIAARLNRKSLVNFTIGALICLAHLSCDRDLRSRGVQDVDWLVTLPHCIPTQVRGFWPIALRYCRDANLSGPALYLLPGSTLRSSVASNILDGLNLGSTAILIHDHSLIPSLLLVSLTYNQPSAMTT